MTVHDQSAASRQFVASCSVYSPTWAKVTGKRATLYTQVAFGLIVLLVLVVFFGRLWGLRLHFGHIGPLIGFCALGAAVILSLGIGLNFLSRSRRKYVITVTGDGLTIDRRLGDVYPFIGARLGLWVDTGVALHLRSGRNQFLLGGRDRRVGPATPLDAAPVPLVDAWLSEWTSTIFSR